MNLHCYEDNDVPNVRCGTETCALFSFLPETQKEREGI